VELHHHPGHFFGHIDLAAKLFHIASFALPGKNPSTWIDRFIVAFSVRCGHWRYRRKTQTVFGLFAYSSKNGVFSRIILWDNPLLFSETLFQKITIVLDTKSFFDYYNFE
jgi:hypothetical protein